jgi:putative glutamine amidotransferase
MSRRPLIGVTATVRGSITMWQFNRLALRRAGARAVRVAADDPGPLDRLDGLVIGGGDDIEPTRYGGVLEPMVKIDPERDELELHALDWAERTRRPVLGICRGAQMINVHRGGSLYGDIHRVIADMPRLRTVLPKKPVDIYPGTQLYQVLRLRCCRVNALHHQSVDRLGQAVRVSARDVYGIVQAVEVVDRPFLLGVQWHPEFLVMDDNQQRLFRALVDTVRGAGAGVRLAPPARPPLQQPASQPPAALVG